VRAQRLIFFRSPEPLDSSTCFESSVGSNGAYVFEVTDGIQYSDSLISEYVADNRTKKPESSDAESRSLVVRRAHVGLCGEGISADISIGEQESCLNSYANMNWLRDFGC
jgi:hypothetical protein